MTDETTKVNPIEAQIRQIIDPIHERLNAQDARLMQLSGDFLESHDEISEQLAELFSDRLTALSLPKSPDRAELYKALAAAQLEIRNADANIENAFLHKKYADLASCLDAIRGPLAKNGIALIQLTEDPGQGVLGIRTILAHESGQTIEDVITMAPPKMDPQGVGSCRTYMRRYAVIAMTGIAGALDDDAEATKADPNAYPRINEAEVEKIIYTADELFGDRADAAVAKMLARVFGGISVVGDIREGEMNTAINALHNAKKLMDKNEAAAKQKEETARKAAAEQS